MSQQARNNPEQSRLEAYRADMAMEEHYKRVMEEQLAEEPYPEPLIEAIHEARGWDDYCKRLESLREKRQTE